MTVTLFLPLASPPLHTALRSLDRAELKASALFEAEVIASTAARRLPPHPRPLASSGSLPDAAGAAHSPAAGSRADAPPVPDALRIPRILHQTYKSAWTPWRVRGMMASWKRQNPDWEASHSI